MIAVDRHAKSTTAGRVRIHQPIAIARTRGIHLIVLVSAGALLLLSLLLPYWHITLHAPQYPRGLHVEVYTWKMSGDVAEVDGLNHYIGMIRLESAAKFERSISRVAVTAMVVLLVASFWLRGRLRWLAIAPAVLYPFAFIADLFAWLYHAGHSLDPHAALSSSIHEFTPRILGSGTIGQFSTDAGFGAGFYLAMLAAILAIVITYLNRAAGDGSR